MRIACAFDHAGVPLRNAVLGALADGGDHGLDRATPTTTRRARAQSLAILDGQAEWGVLVCGSGAGVSVAASKVRGIRAATVSDGYTAHQSVEHDDLNVLWLGVREFARELVRSFAGARLSGAERHVCRLAPGRRDRTRQRRHPADTSAYTSDFKGDRGLMATSTSTSPRAGPIGDIVALGQSVWFDNIRRGSQDHALTSCRSGLAGVARSNGVTVS